MPEREAKSLHVNNGKAQQCTDPHQSAWLTHWTGTRCDASSSTQDHLTRLGRSKGDDHDVKKHLKGVEIASDNFGSSEGIRDVDLAISLKKPSSQSFFKCGQGSEGKTREVQALRPQVSHKKLTTALNVEASSRECQFQSEGVSQNPMEQVKYHMFFGESSHSCSRPSKEHAGSASHIRMNQGAHKLDSCTTRGSENFRQLTAVFASKEHLPETNLAIMEQEYPSYRSHSSALVSKGNLNNFPEHEKSEMPMFLKQNNPPLMKIDPSTSSHHPPAFIEEQYQRMQKHIGLGFFPHQIGSPEMTKSGTVHRGPCSFQNFPHFVHDVETTRLCAPLSSVEGLTGGLHSFSRTTHSLLITKQTDVKLYQENQIFRESRVSTQLKGDALRELNCSHPRFAHGQKGVNLQLLDSSDHESQENVKHVKATGDEQKNESSADTDAMDMEAFKENHLSGVHSSLAIKDIMVESSLPAPRPFALPTERDIHRKHKIELPDINLELSALPAASSSMEKSEPCSSRTQSLDMNTLQFNVDQKSNSKSDECSENNLGLEPGSRWIKRLKLSASSTLALGTKSSKVAEASSHGKLNKFFTRVMEGKPELALDRRHGKESESLMGKCHHKVSQTQTGKCSITEQQPSMASIFGKGESSSVETKRECKDITLSHSWIQRWSRNQGPKHPETVETSKPENSKLALEELQKKQFPSIAAMALMAKAMTGFQQCKFEKKESFVIWNT